MRCRCRWPGPRELPAVRPGPHPAWTSTTSSPATPSSTAPACASAPTSPARCSTTHGRDRRRHAPSASTTTAARPVPRPTYRAPLVVAADGNSIAPVAVDGPARSATTGRWASPCAPTTRARATTTTTSSRWLELWSTRRRRRADPAARLRLDLRRRRRHHQRRPRASSTPPRPSARSTTRTSCGAGSRPCPRSGPTTTTTMAGPIRGAALPMGFNRQPHYADGLLLVGDAGGMVNPFNGEGIAYAMESGRAGGRGHRPGLRPRRRRRPRAGAAVLPEGHEGRARRLLHPRPVASPR